MKITAKTFASVQLPPDKKEHFEFDEEIPGFGERLRKGGSRTLVFQYRLGTKQRRIALGAATVEAFKTVKTRDGEIVKLGIREQAAQLLAQVKLGQDPAGQKIKTKQKATETFEPVGRRWLAVRKHGQDGERIMRPATHAEAERHIVKDCKPLHGLHFATIQQSTFAIRLNEIRATSGDPTANRLRSTLSSLYAWGMRQGMVSHNPVANTAKSKEVARDRAPTASELVEIWNALGDDQYGSIGKLLLLTLQRADEIASLCRSEITKVEVPKSRIDGIERPTFTIDVIDLPGERTKNKRPHLVPLSKPALAILQAQPLRVDDTGKIRDLIFGLGQRGFSGWSKSKERLDERIYAARVKTWEKGGRQGDKPFPMPTWRVHDLRRAGSSLMGDQLGIAPHVVEAILNHVSSARSGKSGTAGVYNRALYLRERVAALNLWADHVMALVGENVVPLREHAAS